jgi:hypothetical protein
MTFPAIFEQRLAVQRCLLDHRGAGVGGPAKHDGRAVGTAEERRDRLVAHVRVHGGRVGVVTIEGLARVHLRRRSDVAALAVQDHHGARPPLTDVGDRLGQVVFGAHGGVVRVLGLEGADQVADGVDDEPVEGQHRSGPRRDRRGHTLENRIETDAQAAPGLGPGGLQFLRKGQADSRRDPEYAPYDAD